MAVAVVTPTLSELARQAWELQQHLSKPEPEAERWLCQHIQADPVLFRAIATPLIAAAVHTEVAHVGRQKRQQVHRDAIKANVALIKAGGDPEQAAKRFHEKAQEASARRGVVKPTSPGVLGLLGMGQDDKRTILDTYRLKQGLPIGDATRADIDLDVQMRQQDVAGLMRDVPWKLTLKRMLTSDTQRVREVVDPITALKLYNQAGLGGGNTTADDDATPPPTDPPTPVAVATTGRRVVGGRPVRARKRPAARG